MRQDETWVSKRGQIRRDQQLQWAQVSGIESRRTVGTWASSRGLGGDKRQVIRKWQQKRKLKHR